MKVAILGATGQTGKSIANGLLSSGDEFDVTALVRPSSLKDAELLDLLSRGAKASPVDLAGPQTELVKTLEGFDVVISAISAANIAQQFTLVDAVKAAGVKRFLPCNFGMVQAPVGVLALAEQKEEVLNYVKAAHVPYTVVDVGYWYQLAFPHLPSEQTNYISPRVFDQITGDGNVFSAYSDLRDVGKWVARIIADPRTLNKKVFVYSAISTTNQIYDALEQASGEKIPRLYISKDKVTAEAVQRLATPQSPTSYTYFDWVKYQYWNIMFVREENTPEYAEYLGYMDATKLYPEVAATSLADFAKQAVGGQVPVLYAKLLAAAKAAAAGQQ